MNKCALYIPRPGSEYSMIKDGYVDSLRSLGWTVYVCNPKTKLYCQQLIEQYNIELIMTHSKYGIRQLPVDTINKRCVKVFIEALPLNDNDLTIDGPYEYADESEPEIILSIDGAIVHTKIEKHLWDSYFSGWTVAGIDLYHILAAGNIVSMVPRNMETLCDMSIVANFKNRQGIMRGLIEPLCRRLELLGYTYQAFGDEIWEMAGLKYCGPLACKANLLSNVYATSNVCPNVHTEEQVSLASNLNERSFGITLCGGVQISDNPLATRYLAGHCEVAVSTTDYINRVIARIEKERTNFDQIKSGVSFVATKHTYFNRLIDLFQICGWFEAAEEVERQTDRIKFSHCSKIDAMISAMERGVQYG